MQKGQALAVVLLILGVVLVVGLSIASRSVTEVNVSSTQEESALALEAAETGIERVFGGVIAGSGGTGNLASSNASYTVSNTSFGAGSVYEVPFKLEEGEVATVGLTGYSSTGVKVCWGKGGGQQPAVEVILYYTVSGQTKLGRGGYDSASPTRSGFLSAGAGGCGTLNYDFSRDVLWSDLGMEAFGMPQIFRIRPIYNGQAVNLAVLAMGSGSLPAQATDVVSTGQSGTSAQRLHATVANWDVPAMFDSALFSGGGGGLTQ